MLKDLDLGPVYDSSDCDLVRDLIVPLLGESQQYWRGVGFFTSGWLKSACEGIATLIENGGTARVVTSPIMQRADWDALQKGADAKRDDVLREILRKNVDDLARALTQDTLNALAWMIADEVFEFRFAIPRDIEMVGDYHDKVGVFIDAHGDAVAIHGSFNDSAKGSLNGEAFSVFKSWQEGQLPYVERHRTRLMKLWSSGNTQFHTLSLPEAVRLQIISLRTGSRPYLKENTITFGSPSSPSRSSVPLRPYQRQAIDAWKKRGCCGILEMATGTGKTYTALAAAAERRDVLKQVAVVILVPYLHLLEQWRINCEKFEFFPILCSGEHGQWANDVRSKVQDFRLGVLSSICILAVHPTAATNRFAKSLAGLAPENTLLIADEVHGLGAPRLRDALIPSASMRLGLSATPRRWYDEEGTATLLNYFNDVCFEYPLELAIGNDLTHYRYSPIPTRLTASEMDEYEELSRNIASLVSRNADLNEGVELRVKKLLLRRAHLISAAENKMPLLLNMLKTKIAVCSQEGKELRDVLVYCAPGSHKKVLTLASSLGLRCHEFVHTVPMDERQEVLRQFADGDIQVLVAIHCLDEGVDIPSTQTAYFLASTTNPREFVQRRGRILRKFPGKRAADVYDFIVLPEMVHAPLRRDVDLGLLRREMPRFAEFAACASNEFEARAVIRDVLDAYQMLQLLDLKPWDIYHQVMESLEIKDRS